MVLVEIDDGNCHKCGQPFRDNDRIEIEHGYECGGPLLLHDRCPEDALFAVARAECVRCGKVHKFTGTERNYVPLQIKLVPCCMGSRLVQVRVTGRWKEDDEE